MDKTNPDHYRYIAVIIDDIRYEPIDVCENYDFCLGNAIKYILRADRHHDGTKLNLCKAYWYLERLLKQEHELLESSYIYPAGSSKHNVAKILKVYREDFEILSALLNPDGSANIENIDNAMSLITAHLEGMTNASK